ITFTPLNKTARLLESQLGKTARLRVGCGVLGGIIFPMLVMVNRAAGNAPGPLLALAALVLCLAGELLERYLFFRAVAPSKMPGSVGE
ncbi:MAG TPA: molybdopterin oxidoreductase, partial [Verrucomicrobiae bacterium]|nr:molybdopterin oxidoreductase [Verrucomicrobiae bacterium]